ncbi:cell growth-regulating nucleolar protein [Strigomonas culicis]|uniref:Cell growth-regulating nucleolar protein n=1 Tax=Strigomonas culicis TaxID=28005 RepID=S9TC63_9TRYP|nr:cell growth-regulating nucleolar protein [Strigomonas culicis]|eukprot:EPY15582.1 cell growth-regulating nucleolar protein [Strigomonas culicis]
MPYQRQQSSSYPSLSPTSISSQPASFLRLQRSDGAHPVDPSLPPRSQPQEIQRIPLRVPPFHLVSVFNDDYHNSTAQPSIHSDPSGPPDVELTLQDSGTLPPVAATENNSAMERNNGDGEAGEVMDTYGRGFYTCVTAATSTTNTTSMNANTQTSANRDPAHVSINARANNSDSRSSTTRPGTNEAPAITNPEPSASVFDVVVEDERSSAVQPQSGSGTSHRNGEADGGILPTHSRRSAQGTDSTMAMSDVKKRKNSSANSMDKSADTALGHDSGRDPRLARRRKGLSGAIKKRLQKFKSRLVPERRTHSEEDEAEVMVTMGILQPTNTLTREERAQQRKDRKEAKARKKMEEAEEEADPIKRIIKRYTQFDGVNSDNEEEVVLFELHQQIIRSIAVDDETEEEDSNVNRPSTDGIPDESTTTGVMPQQAEKGKRKAKLSASGIAFITRMLYANFRREQIRSIYRFFLAQTIVTLSAFIFIAISYGGRLTGLNDYLSSGFTNVVSSALYASIRLSAITGDALKDGYDNSTIYAISTADMNNIIAHRLTLVDDMGLTQSIPGTMHRFCPSFYIGYGATTIFLLSIALALLAASYRLKVW